MLKNFNEVLNKFEKEMINQDRDLEIADGGEFKLFELDQDNIYTLQFNQEEQTYSIGLMMFEENEGDFIEEVYLETYSMNYYNREFLISRIVSYLEKVITKIY